MILFVGIVLLTWLCACVSVCICRRFVYNLFYKDQNSALQRNAGFNYLNETMCACMRRAKKKTDYLLNGTTKKKKTLKGLWLRSCVSNWSQLLCTKCQFLYLVLRKRFCKQLQIKLLVCMFFVYILRNVVYVPYQQFTYQKKSANQIASNFKHRGQFLTSKFAFNITFWQTMNES